MTYEKLKNDVAALGFERAIEDDSALTIAANRALRLIFVDRPVRKAVRLYVPAPKVENVIERQNIAAKESIILPICGRAFSFRILGRGYYEIHDGPLAQVRQFSSDSLLCHSFIRHGGHIEFTAEEDCCIYGFACYGFLVAAAEDDIPEYGKERCIAISDIFKDIMSPVSIPTNGAGEIIRGARIGDGKIYLPFDYDGELSFTYNRLPSEIYSDNAWDIDIPSDMEALLPLLTASFLWLDDDPEKAQYYMAIYRRELSAVILNSRADINTAYKTNGWA